MLIRWMGNIFVSGTGTAADHRNASGKSAQPTYPKPADRSFRMLTNQSIFGQSQTRVWDR